jgi:hypothetical protein
MNSFAFTIIRTKTNMSRHKTSTKNSPRPRTLRSSMTKPSKLLRRPRTQPTRKKIAFRSSWIRKKRSSRVRRMNFWRTSRGGSKTPRRKFMSQLRKKCRMRWIRWSSLIYKYWRTKTLPYTRKRWINTPSPLIYKKRRNPIESLWSSIRKNKN